MSWSDHTPHHCTACEHNFCDQDAPHIAYHAGEPYCDWCAGEIWSNGLGKAMNEFIETYRLMMPVSMAAE